MSSSYISLTALLLAVFPERVGRVGAFRRSLLYCLEADDLPLQSLTV